MLGVFQTLRTAAYQSSCLPPYYGFCAVFQRCRQRKHIKQTRTQQDKYHQRYLQPHHQGSWQAFIGMYCQCHTQKSIKTALKFIRIWELFSLKKIWMAHKWRTISALQKIIAACECSQTAIIRGLPDGGRTHSLQSRRWDFSFLQIFTNTHKWL